MGRIPSAGDYERFLKSYFGAVQEVDHRHGIKGYAAIAQLQGIKLVHSSFIHQCRSIGVVLRHYIPSVNCFPKQYIWRSDLKAGGQCEYRFQASDCIHLRDAHHRMNGINADADGVPSGAAAQGIEQLQYIGTRCCNGGKNAAVACGNVSIGRTPERQGIGRKGIGLGVQGQGIVLAIKIAR